MSISIRFRYRPGIVNLDDRPQSLYVYLTVDGVELPGYTSGVKVCPSQWDMKRQRITSRDKVSQADQDRLEQIHAEHKEIRNQLILAGKPATAIAIKRTWITPHNPPPLAAQAWEQYVARLHKLKGSDRQLMPGTIKKWEAGLTYLRLYIPLTFGRKDVEIDELSVAWAEDFHTWLMTYVDESKATRKRQQKKDTAMKHIEHFQVVMDWVVASRLIAVNPIAKFHLKRDRPKPITYLMPEQITAIAKMTFVGNAEHYRDLTLLACYTGLDYPVLQRVLRYPERYRKTNAYGKEKLVIRRDKKEQEANEGHLSQVPLLPQAAVLLDKYKDALLSYAPQTVNDFMKYAAAQVGFTKSLSFKICRKTAGCLWLNAGYSLEAVSKLLGHKSVKTTQMHYAVILDKRIDTEMEQVGVDVLPH